MNFLINYIQHCSVRRRSERGVSSSSRRFVVVIVRTTSLANVARSSTSPFVGLCVVDSDQLVLCREDRRQTQRRFFAVAGSLTVRQRFVRAWHVLNICVFVCPRTLQYRQRIVNHFQVTITTSAFAVVTEYVY